MMDGSRCKAIRNFALVHGRNVDKVSLEEIVSDGGMPYLSTEPCQQKGANQRQFQQLSNYSVECLQAFQVYSPGQSAPW